MGVSLGDVPDGYEAVDNPPIPVEDTPDMPRLHEVFGAEKGDDGWYRLPVLAKEFSAPHAALHIGPIHIVFDITAHELAAQAAGTDRIQVENWYVMFVKAGPDRPIPVRGRSHRQPAAGASTSTSPCSTRAATTAPSPPDQASSAWSDFPTAIEQPPHASPGTVKA